MMTVGLVRWLEQIRHEPLVYYLDGFFYLCFILLEPNDNGAS